MSQYIQRIENGHQVTYLSLDAAASRFRLAKTVLIALLGEYEPLTENGLEYYTEAQYNEAMTPTEPEPEDESPVAA